MPDSARSWLLRHPKGPGGDTNYILKSVVGVLQNCGGKFEGREGYFRAVWVKNKCSINYGKGRGMLI